MRSPSPSGPPAKHAGRENFPVASWLCPAGQRPAVMALYRYARTADDLADEGNVPAPQRLAALHDYRQTLDAVLSRPDGPAAAASAWPEVFGALATSHARWHWPAAPLHDLLDAFVADVRHQPMADEAALLAYCRQSANPVGRLLLHLMPAGALPPQALAQSDAVCTALQLINFWQDLAEDLRQQRHYLPQTTLDRVGLSRAVLSRPEALHRLPSGAAHALRLALLHELARAESLLAEGAPLATALSQSLGARRWGWELRAIVQGGALRLRQLRRAVLAGWPLWQQPLPRSGHFALQTLHLAWRWPELQAVPSPLTL